MSATVQRFETIDVWTDRDVVSVENALLAELRGEFVTYPSGARSILFGDVPGDVSVHLVRRRVTGAPTLRVFVDERSDDRSNSTQQRVAREVFAALGRVLPDRLELIAADDSVVEVRSALRDAS